MSDVEQLLKKSRQLLIELEEVSAELAVHQNHPEAVIEYDLDAFAVGAHRSRIDERIQARQRCKQRQR